MTRDELIAQIVAAATAEEAIALVMRVAGVSRDDAERWVLIERGESPGDFVILDDEA